mgnify:CR=1 FL=1|jgi:multiple sugar transport system substrate-binding protein
MDSHEGRKTTREKLNTFIQTLRMEIRTGKRSAGEYLPSEKTFAEQYGLSNQSVRKGLDILAAEGLIEKIPRVGSKVIRPPSEARTVKLGFHTSVTREADIHALLDEFRRLHPEIDVQTVPLSHHDYGYIQQYLNGGILDVVMMNYTHFQDFVETGNTVLLKPLERNPDIYPFLSEAFTHRGQLLVQPFIFSPLVLCYNPAHFAEKGLSEPDSSWQWEDLIGHAAKLAIPNERLGFHCELFSPNRWPLIPLQKAVKAERGADGSIRLAGTELMDALRVCREMKREFPLISESITTGESERMLAMGKASMIMTSYFYLNYLAEADIAFELAPVPHFGAPATMLLNIGLAVNSLSNAQDEAVRLVDFLSSYQAQLMIRKKTYSLPAYKRAAEWRGEEERYRPSRFSLFRETIPGFRYFTGIGITSSELAIISREVKLYWAGLESEETFCQRAEELLQLRDKPSER